MASGQIVVHQKRIIPPATSFATIGVINGTSTPAERGVHAPGGDWR